MRLRLNRNGRVLHAAFLASALAAVTLTGCSKEQPSSTTPETPTKGASGTATPTAGGKKKIVFVFKKGGISYSEACKAGAEQANNDPALNVSVEYQASTEGTAEKQADIINQAIVGHADAIVVSPVDAQAIVPALNKAVDAGIKVFTWDSDAPASKRSFYVAAIDDIGIGADIADSMAQSIGEKGKVLIYSGNRTAENLNLHIKGVEQALKKYPNITLVTPYIYNEEDKTKATTVAVQALQANPDLAGIIGVNSLAPPSSGEAVRKVNRIGKVKVWGLALPSETKSYLLDDSVTGIYLWNPKDLTYETAVLVKDALDGKMPVDGADVAGKGKIAYKDGIVTLPAKVKITKENVAQFDF